MEKFYREAARDRRACARVVQHHQSNRGSGLVLCADGVMRVANATENGDLFWAIRSGNGNFGVVSSFEFSLHPIGPEVLSGLIVHIFGQCTRAAAKLPRHLRPCPRYAYHLGRNETGAAAAFHPRRMA